jgi:hypothetical protein
VANWRGEIPSLFPLEAIMVIMTSAVEAEFALRLYRQRLDQQVEIMKEIFFPRLYDLIYKRVFPQRPHTDDMMQMCIDLGIDVPDRQRISLDGLTFDFRP